METSCLFSDVLSVNRQFLLAAHDALLKDPAAAAFIYHLQPELAARLGQASVTAIEAAIQKTSRICLIAPIPNLLDVLDAPPEISPAAAAMGMRLDFLRRSQSRAASLDEVVHRRGENGLSTR